MNIYDAIMTTASHIERTPCLYAFHNTRVPECGTPGCLLGWIGRFLDVRADAPIQVVVERLGLGNQCEFYAAIERSTPNWPQLHGKPWTEHAATAAAMLRNFANARFHRETPKPVTPPDWNAIAAKWTVGDDVRSQELVS